MTTKGIRHLDIGTELTRVEWEAETSHYLASGTGYPSTPAEMDLFYRTDEHKWYCYTGSGWTELTAGGYSGGNLIPSVANTSTVGSADYEFLGIYVGTNGIYYGTSQSVITKELSSGVLGVYDSGGSNLGHIAASTVYALSVKPYTGNNLNFYTQAVDDTYNIFYAQDNDTDGFKEIARMSSASDPYFSFGGSQDWKFYNSGSLVIGSSASFYNSAILYMQAGSSIQSYVDDDAYFPFYAKDTGVGQVEVGRVAGAANPYFSFGGSQQFKFYNSGGMSQKVNGASYMYFYPNVISMNYDATKTGSWIINTPVSRTSNTMFMIHVTGYYYSTTKLLNFWVYGYSTEYTTGNIDTETGGVTNYGMVDIGQDGLPKYVGIDGTTNCLSIAIGDTDDEVYYGRLTVDFYNTQNSTMFDSGWTTDYSTTENFGWGDKNTLTTTIDTVYANKLGVGITSNGSWGTVLKGTYPFQIKDSSNNAVLEFYADIDENRYLNGMKIVGYGQDLVLTTSDTGLYAVKSQSTFHPYTADTYALGGASNEWHALYIGTDKIYFGTGQDVNLYRGAADTLKTDDTFNAYQLQVNGVSIVDYDRRFMNYINDMRYAPGDVSFWNYGPNALYSAEERGYTASWTSLTGVTSPEIIWYPDTGDRFCTLDLATVSDPMTIQLIGTMPVTTAVNTIRIFFQYHGGPAYNSITFYVQRNDDVWVEVPVDSDLTTDTYMYFSQPLHDYAPYPTYTSWKGIRIVLSSKVDTSGYRYIYGAGLFAPRDVFNPYLVNKRGDTLYGTLNTRHILPTANSTYDLGSGTYRWNNLYLDTDLDFTTMKIKDDSGNLYYYSGGSSAFLAIGTSYDNDRVSMFKYTPGTTGAVGGILEIGQLNKNDANWTHGFTYLYANGAARVAINQYALYPYTANTYDLGGTTQEWHDIYVGNTIYFNTNQDTVLRSVEANRLTTYDDFEIDSDIATTGYVSNDSVLKLAMGPYTTNAITKEHLRMYSYFNELNNSVIAWDLAWYMITHAFFYNGSTYTTITDTLREYEGTATILEDTSDYLYIGFDDTGRNRLKCIFETYGVGITLSVEYSKGSSTWGALTITDGTSNFTANGWITWTAPGDWATDTVNSVGSIYWIRFKSTSSISTSPVARVMNSSVFYGQFFNGTVGYKAKFQVGYTGNIYSADKLYLHAGGAGSVIQGSYYISQDDGSHYTNTNWLSTTDNTHDLGSATIEWKDLYIDGTAYIDGFGETTQFAATAGIRLAVAGTIEDQTSAIGTSQTDDFQIESKWLWHYGLGWAVFTSGDPQLWMSGYAGIRFYVGGAERLHIQGAGSNDMEAASDIVPSVTNTYTLGDSSYVWNEIYGKDIYATNKVTITNYLDSGNTDTATFQLRARDTGVGLVQIGAFIGAADPYLQLDHIRLTPIATASLPATAVEGMLYWDTTLDKLVVYNGGWTEIGGGDGYDGTDLIPIAASTYDLGSTTYEFDNLYIGTGRVYLYSDQYENIRSTGTAIVFAVGNADELGLSDTTLYPTTTGGLDLGSATYKYNSAWLSGQLNLGGTDSSYIILNLVKNFTSTTSSVIGGYYDVDLTSTLGASVDISAVYGYATGNITENGYNGSIYGGKFYANAQTGTAQYVAGAYYLADSSVVVDALDGAIFYSRYNGTSTQSTAYGIYSGVWGTSSATISYAAGIYAWAEAYTDFTGTITYGYGIRGRVENNATATGKVANAYVISAMATQSAGNIDFTTIYGITVSAPPAYASGTAYGINIMDAGDNNWDGHLTPIVDNTWNIGSASYSFLNLYIGTGRIYLYTDEAESIRSDGTNMIFGVGSADEVTLSASALYPSTADGNSLGTTSNEWANLYVGTGRIYLYDDQAESIRSDGTNMIFGVNSGDEATLSTAALYPSTTLGLDLGTTSVRWSTIYGAGMNLTYATTVDNSMITLYNSNTTADMTPKTALLFNIYDHTTATEKSAARIVAGKDAVGTTLLDGTLSIYTAVNDTLTLKLLFQDTEITTYDDIRPTTTSTLDLGGSSYRWNAVYGNQYYIKSNTTSDGYAYGIITDILAGESIVWGNALYVKSDGKVWKSDADASTTMPVFGIALGSYAAEATATVLLYGFCTETDWTWTVGGMVYASTTAGSFTQTVPSGAGDQVQAIGIAMHADILYFNPSLTLVEV